jgi:hypothetical protein
LATPSIYPITVSPTSNVPVEPSVEREESVEISINFGTTSISEFPSKK